MSRDGSRIVRLSEQYLLQAAAILKLTYPNQIRVREWIADYIDRNSTLSYVILDHTKNVLGLDIWTQPNGSYTEAVVELLQIAVHPDVQRRGMGSRLVRGSFLLMEDALYRRGQKIGLLMANTTEEEFKQNFFQKNLGMKISAETPGLPFSDHITLYACRDDIPLKPLYKKAA